MTAMLGTSGSVALITSYYEAARYGGAEIAGEALAANRVASEHLDAAPVKHDRTA